MITQTSYGVLIVEIAWFLVPCILINACLNIFYEVKRRYGWESFDKAFDFGLHLWGNRLLGQSTTWGGLLISLVVGLLLKVLFGLPGIIIALGCFFGHATGSFIKRRIGLPRGSYLPIVDHGDYIIITGAILFWSGSITGSIYFLGIVTILIVHPCLCLAAYYMGIRDNPL